MTIKEVFMEAIAHYSETEAVDWVYLHGTETGSIADYCYQTITRDPERVMSARARVLSGDTAHIVVVRGVEIPESDAPHDEFAIVTLDAPMQWVRRIARAHEANRRR